MNNFPRVGCTLSLLAFAFCLVAAAQDPSDYNGGYSAGYQTCSGTCSRSLPSPPPSMSSYTFGWFSGCAQANAQACRGGGATAPGNPSGGSATMPPGQGRQLAAQLATTLQGQISFTQQLLANAVLDKRLTSGLQQDLKKMQDDLTDVQPYAQAPYPDASTLDSIQASTQVWSSLLPDILNDHPEAQAAINTNTRNALQKDTANLNAIAQKAATVAAQINGMLAGGNVAGPVQAGLENDLNVLSSVQGEVNDDLQQVAQIGAMDPRLAPGQIAGLTGKIAALQNLINAYAVTAQRMQLQYSAAQQKGVTIGGNAGAAGAAGTNAPPADSAMTPGKAAQIIAADPALRQDVAVYVAKLEKEGKSREQIRQAILDQVQLYEARQLAADHASAVAADHSSELATHNAGSIAEDHAGQSGTCDSHAVGQNNSHAVDQYNSSETQQHATNGIGQYNALQPGKYQAGQIQADGSQEVQAHQADEIQQHQAQQVQQYSAQQIQQRGSQQIGQYQAGDIQQYRAQEIQAHQANQIQKHQAGQVQQYSAQELQQHHAQQIQAYHSQQIQAYHATEPAAYHASEIQPVRSAQEIAVDRPASQENGGCGPAVAVGDPGDAVAPLSDGLTLDMNDAQIGRTLGAPAGQSWDARTFSYPGLAIEVGGREKTIWSATINSNCVALHSGITVGSARALVARVFGDADTPLSGQYKLTFTYDGDRVASIKIEPANGDFRAPSAVAGSPVHAVPSPHANPSGAGSLAGDWYCVSPSATVGTIRMDGHGHYTFGGNAGQYTVSGADITFSGIPWDHGHAQLVKGNIEFYYSDSQGYKYYFVFAR